jgi:hypothetical protein
MCTVPVPPVIVKITISKPYQGETVNKSVFFFLRVNNQLLTCLSLQNHLKYIQR